MSSQASRLQLLNNYPLRLHCCPITKLEYFGQCGNIECPVNIARHGANSGCFLQTAKPNIIDVGAQLHISTREVKRQYQKAIEHTENFLRFYQWLQQLRANYIYVAAERNRQPKDKYCKICGISGTLQCINTVRCQRRSHLWQRTQTKFPFSVPELKVTAYEFWHIILAQQKKIIDILPLKTQERGEKLIRLLPNLTSATQPTTGTEHVTH